MHAHARACRKKNATTLDLTPKLCVLTRLHLSGCPIGDAGAELLFDCVGNETCRLEVLEVSERARQVTAGSAGPFVGTLTGNDRHVGRNPSTTR